MIELKTLPPQDVVAVVTGIQIGEETKGAAVEWLARELNATSVIRNGGCQAGHHIVTADGREQMFSHFAAATFEGAHSYLRHMVIDPVLLFREALQIEAQGVDDPFKIITIDGENISITPFHGAWSRFKEMLRTEKKGTVGLGVGEAVKDDQQGAVTIRAKDFLSDEKELLVKVEAIRQRKVQQAIELISALGIEELPEDAFAEMQNLHNLNLVSLTVQSFKYLVDLLAISDDAYFEELLSMPGNLVTEPSHGALLHPFAFAPHTTQVDPTSKELIEELQQNGHKKVVRLGVGRCYMTRHGAGPLVSFDREMTDTIHETHNAAGTWSNEWLGEFRIGHYDLIATQYGLAIAGGNAAFDGLMMSYLDVLNSYQKWGVVEAYQFHGEASDLADYFELNGEVITGIKLHPDTRDAAHAQHQLRLTELLKNCTPIVSYLYPTESQTLEEVFLAYVEEKTGIPVIAVSKGPKAEDRTKRPSWDTVFGLDQEGEKNSTYKIFQPAGVELYEAGKTETSLPAEIAKHPQLVKEAQARRELNALLAAAFQKVADPNLDFSKAVELGVLSNAEVNLIYQKLATFMRANQHHSRLILYLPAQVLPDMTGVTHSSAEARQFAGVLQDAWLKQLQDREPRASYIDGDILEAGLGAPEMIRKAGHLLPELLRRGILQSSEVLMILEMSDEPELVKSILEGATVAHDQAYISYRDWQKFMLLSSTKMGLAESLRPAKTRATVAQFDFVKTIADLEAQFAENSAYTQSISSGRAQWEKAAKMEKAIEQAAAEYSQQVIKKQLKLPAVFAINQVLGIKTVLKIGESLAKIELCVAKSFAELQLKDLWQIWQSADASATTKDAIHTTLSHWKKLGVIEQAVVEKFGVIVPDLAQAMPIDVEKSLVTEYQFATESAKKIAQHPVLAQYLFPVVIMVGSRVKGQAGLSTDYDGGLVFKPNTPWEKRTEILAILRKDIPEFALIEKPLEFWLSQTESGYGLKAAPVEMHTVVRPDQIHFFLNSLWIGQSAVVEKIRGNFMKKYLDLSRFGAEKTTVSRELYRQLEMDMTQYRIMHKGYRKFYPSAKGAAPAHAELIDWESDYWDPGFKQVATQLFLSRVFLPDLA